MYFVEELGMYLEWLVLHSFVVGDSLLPELKYLSKRFACSMEEVGEYVSHGRVLLHYGFLTNDISLRHNV